MPQDPYSLLGVSSSASEAELKSAYRKLAKKLHPDLNPGRKDIEQKFKEVTAAYDLLSDPDKRARFDRGEIDAQGNERGFRPNDRGYGSDFSHHHRTNKGAYSSYGRDFNPEDIFAEFFGRGKSDGFEAPRGADVVYEVVIPLTEACLGGKKRITLSGNKTIDITIPPGTESGHKLRLRGLGQTSRGKNGDAIIKIQVAPHAFFERKGFDIHLEVPISLPEALLGGSIKVPTLDGSVALKIQKGSNSGKTMRLKGKGVAREKGEAGDMFVTLKIMLPETGREELEKWAQKNAYDPRKKLGW